MDPIANWSFDINSLGYAQVFSHGWDYAGGEVLLGIGGTAQEFPVYDLGGGVVVMTTTLTDQNGNTTIFAWNSHYGTSDSSQTNGGMLLWHDGSDEPPTYWSNIDSPSGATPEQRFVVGNLGGGAISLRNTDGNYLSGISGGWYPEQWSLGSGSVVWSSTPVAVQVGGSQWPIFLITNSCYGLDLRGQEFGALSLANVDARGANVGSADLTQVSSLTSSDWTGATLDGARLPRLSLGSAQWSNASFRGTDLRGVADADGASMPSTDFTDGNAQNVSFARANLQAANFAGTRLDGASFVGADLSGAVFTGASLAGADFRGASMIGSKFVNCDLSTAKFDTVPNFTRATSNRTTFESTTVPFAALNSNWSYLDLGTATITGIPGAIAQLVADQALLPKGLVLSKIDLTGASFRATSMPEVVLDGANLANASLVGTRMQGARLDGANLSGADLSNAWLIADQGETNISEADSASLVGAFLVNTTLDGAHCDGVDFSDCLFVTSSFLSSTASAQALAATMNLAKFNNATVVGARFDGAQLAGANFANAKLVGSTFKDYENQPARLVPTGPPAYVSASVSSADLTGVDFTGANMDGLDMSNATVSRTGGVFEQMFTGYAGQSVPVSCSHGPTVLGTTTSTTVCPGAAADPVSSDSTLACAPSCRAGTRDRESAPLR
jgi:uncharacterized protein YjbI with pentapeptide repeats